ncbi:hypothetical protein [Mycobacterium sp.]|uniref:hypothetical protein n=1 Tax=Mycobacterium sp. TaxID=1785 RepID=UPI0031DBBED1
MTKTAVDEAVRAWLTDSPNAADKIAALPPQQRRAALARLGYTTPAHQSLFGL